MFLLLALACAADPALASSPDIPLDESSIEPVYTEVTTSYTRISPVLDSDLQDLLPTRDWKKILIALRAVNREDLHGSEQRELDFLRAWAHIHSNTPTDAVKLLSAIGGAVSVPQPYRDLVRGELLLADDQAVEALTALESVPKDSPIYPRAAVLRAQTLKKLERVVDASKVFEEIASRPDPSSGNELALMALAFHHGPGTDAAYPYLRRLWANYPWSKQGKKAGVYLGKYPNKASFQATSTDWSVRAERFMYARRYDDAIAAADKALALGLHQDQATCRALYAKGRSAYKQNHLTTAIDGFQDAGTRCQNVDGAYGPRALYVQGTAQFRRKQYKSSAATFLKIPELYPDHSMADDGYMHAGIAQQESGELSLAQSSWLRALEEFPDGDTAAEATWRLAWSLYLDGKPDDARAIAERLGALSPAVDAVHVDAGRYWNARWSLYPDVDHPNTEDPEGRGAAIAGWVALLKERPFSFYSILASARLREVAPDEFERLNVRGDREDLQRAWKIRVSTLESESLQNGVALARLGLVLEAKAEWKQIEPSLTPDEQAWLISLRGSAGDWLLAHQDFRRWITSHPVGSLGEGERAVVRVAYPDRYWDEVQTASAPYSRFEPRLFHSLVREESNFNREIVSFAGARGLSQLMPATAKQTAGWLGKTISMTELFVPEKNLAIGARYLEAVFRQLDDSPYCSLAGYNAGPFRVQQWEKAWGNPPTDEFVERIPFRETRGYVKRVMGTWQTYRWYVDEGEPFPDLSAFNHEMQPK